MKKLLICVSALGVMSFTANEVHKNYLLSETINELEDLQEWIQEDMNNGNIKEAMGILYLYKFRKCEKNITKFVDENE